MEKEKIIINGIFYLFLTTCFLLLWIKEKEVVELIKEYRGAFSEKIIEIFNVESGATQKGIKKTVNFVETIGSALILVLIIQKFYLGNFLVPTGSMIPTIMPKDRIFGNMVIYNFKQPEREDIIVFREPVENKVLYTKRVMGLPGEEVKIEFGHLYVNNKRIDIREYSNLGFIEYDTWTIPKKGDTVEIVPGANYSSEIRSEDIKEIQEFLLEKPGQLREILPDVDFYVNGKKTGMILDFIHEEKTINEILDGNTVKIQIDENYYMVLGDNTDGSYDSRMWGFVAESRIKGKAFVRFWPLNRIGLLK
ncbi:signal peptidase I [uncultured Ilyobacter sp.]|uniref:signal peptidase I n=1 Tax=uncultured Ilyobacter sp. TaxID=544433 RepID=UPI0029C891F3|nr:signal peptidase I [uncultured Ilyobacter sp.]